MKIKTWLILSYLIVMTLPIVASYILYISLSDYDKEQDIKEYLEFQKIVTFFESHLADESLYDIQPRKNYQHLQNLVKENIKIDIYRYDGVMLFSTMDTPGAMQMFQMNPDTLYQDLNKYQKKTRTYAIKKLVFDEEEHVVGLYEITMGRKAWVETSNQRTILMFVYMVVFFIVLYLIVLFLINRKLFRPMKQLQQHMKAFADGKEANERIVKSKDEIGVLISRFEQMKAQIEETRMALRKQQQEKEYMVASLSHDLKTPLTVIRTYSEALENSHLSEKEKAEYQTILYDKLDHMKQMIDDLSVYTALQSTKNILEPVHVNGAEFFDMLFSGYEEPCARKGITLTTEFQGRNSYVLDPKQMIRVVDNLMENGIRYTPKDGNIWLAAISSTKELPEYIFSEFAAEVNEWRRNGTVLFFQNEGKGMKQSQLEKVFQPFYQDDASRGKGATSGLGLSIARMIIEKHGGKMNIWSLEEKGTLIACYLAERKG